MRLAMTLSILAGTLLGAVVYGCTRPKVRPLYEVTLYTGPACSTRWWAYDVGGAGGGWSFRDAGTGRWMRVSGNVVIEQMFPTKEAPNDR